MTSPTPTLPGEVRNVPPALRGIDTDRRLNTADLLGLRALGFQFVLRYVPLTTPPPPAEKNITFAEGLDIINAGFGLMLLQTAPDPFFQSPNGPVADAINRSIAAVANAQIAGYKPGASPGASLFLDVENVPAGTPANDVIAYCTTWAASVRNGGYAPGLYLGAGSQLNANQLAALPFEHFWKSGSNVPTPTGRGFVLIQDFPFDVDLPGVSVPVDTNTSQNDLQGRSARYRRLAQ